MLKSFLLFTAVVLLVAASASAPARAPQESGAGKKISPEALAKAKKVYNLDCALCHGATGDGKTDLAKDMQMTMADWTDPKSLAGQTDQQLFDTIRKGKGKMPAEDEARAKNEDVRDLVQYIRTFGKEGTAAPVAPATTPAVPATGQPAPATPAPTPQATSSSPTH
jgi:cytochrome c5